MIWRQREKKEKKEKGGKNNTAKRIQERRREMMKSMSLFALERGAEERSKRGKRMKFNLKNIETS